MNAPWLWLLAACAVAATNAGRGGSSLRGALEALQRRQRSRLHAPASPNIDYDNLYEFVPPQGYPDLNYAPDVEDVIDEDPNANYVIKLLDNDPRPLEAYEYRVVKKKILRDEEPKKESAFRERSHHSSNDRLRDLFMDRNDAEDKEISDRRAMNEEEYEKVLKDLWNKQRSNVGVVKYKEKVVKKRYPDNWGPIAFKRKRSSEPEGDRPIIVEYDPERKQSSEPSDPDYNAYEVTNDDDDKDDMREEYAIAFQPLDDDNINDLIDEDQYTYENMEKRFPVTKRSSGPYSMPKKRFVQEHMKRETPKEFRSASGTDPRVIKDLSKFFGGDEGEIIKSPVKRSSGNEHDHHDHHGHDQDHEDHDEHSHDRKPPTLTVKHHNHTHERSNSTHHDDDSHEQHGHLHHPGVTGQEVEHHDHDHKHHDHGESEKPMTLKKRAFQVSDYFGIDKRSKKRADISDYFGIDKRRKKSVAFVNDLNQERLRKQYFDTFNKEVVYPLNSFRQHSSVKRNYKPPVASDESEIQVDSARAVAFTNEKRSAEKDSEAKLDNIDRKLKNMEGLMVDEALHYSSLGEELDSKEEQEMKEKLLSRLAAAYSLEKMRKALKEFKQSLQAQKTDLEVRSSPVPTDEAKAKRVAIKKEKVELSGNDIPPFIKSDEKNDDFEEEQGAGHYLNGKTEEQYSEGYMGSGRHRTPVISTAGASGSCPVLAKIVQRCRGVDLLAGDRGQLFLPLCSLHQICYLCGEAPPTTCDLVFLSEADTTCEGDMGCQRAARAALMALRELHDNLADELDGECEASPCLPATLKLNLGWQRALQR